MATMQKIAKRITLTALSLMALCMLPVFIYSLIGPEDGNPIGLGLLFVFGAPFFGAVAAVGGVMWLARIHAEKGEQDPGAS